MDELMVRETDPSEFENVVDYFLKADKEYLLAMGVDIPKLPSKEIWLQMLRNEHVAPLENKKFYYVTWLLNNIPVGHSNINKIIFGQEAYMHLHMWFGESRKQGRGLQFIQLSIPHYFNKFKLKNLFCEPYALNPAPNRTLRKAGFDLIKSYETTPGWINFHQQVNLWQLQFDKFTQWTSG